MPVVPLSDPRVAAIPVQECGEPLVDMASLAVLLVDDRRADPAGAYAHLRSGVVDRLVTAQSLLPREVRLLIIEGYRPPAIQERYIRVRHEQLRRAHPGWPAARLYEETSRAVPPTPVAPHVAGAAVDLTVQTGDGNEPAAGTRVRRHWELLRGALHAVQLVNDPTEWWHWSYGDRYWAFVSGAAHARYGPVADLTGP